MRYFLAVVGVFSVSMLAYWLGGGNFDRGDGLVTTYVMSIIFSAIVCGMLWED